MKLSRFLQDISYLEFTGIIAESSRAAWRNRSSIKSEFMNRDSTKMLLVAPKPDLRSE